MSAADDATLLMIKGAIFDLPSIDQEKVADAANRIRAVISEFGAAGVMAAALVSAEIAAK